MFHQQILDNKGYFEKKKNEIELKKPIQLGE